MILIRSKEKETMDKILSIKETLNADVAFEQFEKEKLANKDKKVQLAKVIQS